MFDSESTSPTPRATFTEDVEMLLKSAYAKIEAVQKEISYIKATCNHTTKKGASCIERLTDPHDDKFWYQCSVCRTILD